MRAKPTVSLRGMAVYKAHLSREQQRLLLEEIRGIERAAPLFAPRVSSGRKMSVRMTSAGKYGWVSDTRGYRYERCHPSGKEWPPIPPSVLEIWHALTINTPDPECCLINYYGQGARMGLHQDRDEADFRWPVVSISLGDDATFRIGGTSRGGPTDSIILSSGDVLVMGGSARLLYHGIDRIRYRSSSLLKHGGRLNLTLRVVG